MSWIRFNQQAVVCFLLFSPFYGVGGIKGKITGGNPSWLIEEFQASWKHEKRQVIKIYSKKEEMKLA